MSKNVYQKGIYLGFDFGLKRMGVAVGQKITCSARPLTILDMENGVPVWTEIEQLFKEWQPTALVVGSPHREEEKNEIHTSGSRVRKALNIFSIELRRRFLNSIYFWDEHLSTREAHSQIAENAFPARKHMNPVDDISAQLILESWLKKDCEEQIMAVNQAEQEDLNVLIHQMAQDLTLYLRNRDITQKIALIGIHTGGVWIAEKLHCLLGVSLPLGVLDISFYRDDFTRVGLHPKVKPSSLPFDVNGLSLILVDDVIHTGRTIRAALNEIFDYGRPDTVVLTALVERSGRELPIRADIVGKRMTLGRDEYVKLSGPDPLTLTILHKVND